MFISNHIKIVAGVLISVFLQVACSARNIYPDVKMDENVLVRQWARETKKEFMAGVRGNDSSLPVVFENTLVFGTENYGIVSLYSETNEIRWVLPIPGGVESELTVEGSTLYFVGADGFLYSVDIDNGRPNWRYEVRNPVASKPVLFEGRLFVTTSDDTVFAFDAGSGEWLWHYRRRSSPTATIHGASAPVVYNQELILGLSDGYLIGVSINDGTLKWEKKLHRGLKFTDVDASIVIDGKQIYVPSYDGALYSLNLKDRRVLWRFDAGGSNSVTIEDDKLYFSSSDGTVYSLNKESSKVLWKFPVDDGVPTQLVTTKDYVVVGSSHQYLYVLDKSTGQPRARFSTGHNSGWLGSPVYDPKTQRLYALSRDGNLYAFTLFPPREDNSVWPSPYVWLRD